MLAIFFVAPAGLALLIDPSGRLGGLLASLGIVPPIELPLSPRAIFPALYLFTFALLAWLWLDRSFKRRQLWNARAAGRDLSRILTLFVIGAALLALITLGTFELLSPLLPEHRREGPALFRWPRESPASWGLIMVLYPILSAFPQEITHRAFWFHRYGGLFGLDGEPVRGPLGRGAIAAIGVNTLAFMWAHAVMWNWIALALTLPGGMLFAWTYLRTRSTLAAGIEHALYGNWIFSIGLGWFLFTGSVGAR